MYLRIMNDEVTHNRTRIQATENSFLILEEIRRRDVAGVSEIATELEMSKSTVYEHLTTLQGLGYVDRIGDQYRLGIAFLTLGGHARQHEELFQIATSEADNLARETEERVKIVIEKDGKGIYLYQAQGAQSIQTDAHVGTRVNVHATAAGKALLAHVPPDRVDEIITQHGLPKMTDNTITTAAELQEELETVRATGIAFDDEERIEGIRCVAAPLLKEDECLGSISVSGPKTRLSDERFRTDLPETVRDTARIIKIMAENM